MSAWDWMSGQTGKAKRWSAPARPGRYVFPKRNIESPQHREQPRVSLKAKGRPKKVTLPSLAHLKRIMSDA